MKYIKNWFADFVDIFFPSISAYKMNDKKVIEYIENNTLVEMNCRRICSIGLLLILLPFGGCTQLYPEFLLAFGVNIAVSLLLAIFTIVICVKVYRAKHVTHKGILQNKEEFQRMYQIYWVVWAIGMMLIGFGRLNANMNGQYLYLTQLCLSFFPLLSRKAFRKVGLFTMIMGVLLTINLLLIGMEGSIYVIIFILTNMLLVFIASMLIQRLNLSINVMSAYLKLVGFMDPLTGALNRRGYAWKRSEIIRMEESVGVIILDIDFFKKYNDTFGHVRGDEILKGIVETVKKHIHERTDCIVRYGGEEFVVLSYFATKEETLHLAEELHQAIYDLHYESAVPEVNPYLSVSIGVDYTVVGVDTQIENLVAKADQALYYAKNHGRNQVILWRENLR